MYNTAMQTLKINRNFNILSKETNSRLHSTYLINHDRKTILIMASTSKTSTKQY